MHTEAGVTHRALKGESLFGVAPKGSEHWRGP